MKKIILSVFVITTFIFYSLYQKLGGVTWAPVFNPLLTSRNSIPDSSNISSNPSVVSTSAPSNKNYKDGSFTGDVTDAYYGNVQVKTIISGGKITDVQFLQYPNDRSTSIAINSEAMPQLTQEAISAQTAQVDIVSGATQTSEAFRQSLQSALDKAGS